MTDHPVKALGALLCRAASMHAGRRRCERRRINQMADVLVIAHGALLASRPLRRHQADLAVHLRAVDEIDHTLADPTYRTGRDFFSLQAATVQSTLQGEYQADLEDERARGADGWIGHLDASR